ncbi:MAG: type I-U CRISPR-associated helicase/endonuclease Cas3 [Rhodospirillales bacterium]|nr:type I-U CRISPR-associated helicase/endonuclease Cas3 [Rhodospirillales bacterium]
MDSHLEAFDKDFAALSGFDRPLLWQRRLFLALLEGDVPSAVDLPTGLGKTSVMTIWLIARAHGAKLPRRLVYVVDRRAVVDQATEEAEKLRWALEGRAEHFDRLDQEACASAKQAAAGVKRRLGLKEDRNLPISTLRGRYIDNREWLADPTSPAIVVGTVDMVGSRLLFSGYGVSRKMRPYHAGLLGMDSWLVLDEAHLVPPFEKLLEAIEHDGNLFGPAADEMRTILPCFKLLSLSATGRERKGEVFRLSEEDVPDVKRRLFAPKSVTVVSGDDKPLEQALADHAWLVAERGTANVRCLIYCDSREVAERTERALKKLEDAGRTRGSATPKAAIELFVGARRAFEREKAREWLKTHGFLAGSPASEQSAFLIATSAGEVGVDLDADHMVGDLVPWERMVQRLGRVNRRGMGDARVTIIDRGEPKPKKPEAPTASETRAMIAHRVLPIIESLPVTQRGFDASPGAIRELKLRAESDRALGALLEDASTPAPLRPALTRALVDSWSMTSLEEHPGRPDIEPWLRGWIEEDEPQTSVVWRSYLPVREGDPPSQGEVDGFFEAAPPHASELLETETWRVVDWLMQRAKSVVRPDAATPLDRDMAVAFVLTPAREVKRRQDDGMLIYAVSDLLVDGGSSTRLKDRLERELAGAILVVDARVGGLASNGLLSDDEDAPAATADAQDATWLEPEDAGRPAVGFRVHPNVSPDDTGVDTNEGYVFATDRSDEDVRVHFIETWTTEESRAASRRAQLLEEHHLWTEEAAIAIAAAIGLDGHHAQTLRIAARLHDEGKKARRWQRAFHAPSSDVYAKTKGPLNRSYLDGYRHEFGSIPMAEKDTALKALPDEMADLALHLIAAHHGFARPLIETRGCDDAPRTLLEDRAREVALRFARLQERWGPWGLAWWEALLRAADQQASHRNDNEGRAAGG